VNSDVTSVKDMIEYPDIFESFTAPGDIPNDKKTRLYFWLIAFSRTREHQWFEYKNGALDDTAWNSYANVIPWAFGTERNKNMWETFKINFDSDYVQFVDDLLANSNITTGYLEDLQ
jgi:hypothetical protein